MNKITAFLLTGMFAIVTAASTVEAQRSRGAAELQRMAADTLEAMLQAIDPDLLKRAAEKGIYKRDEYPVLRRMNPFFIRGDFNGDGAMDLAFWVTQRSSGLEGVAVVHSTLDTVYYFGAGHGSHMSSGKRGQVSADAWHVLPAGSVEQPVNMSVPEIGAVDGQPFTFRRETLQFHWLGKSSFVYYWANGRYWEIWTGD